MPHDPCLELELLSNQLAAATAAVYKANAACECAKACKVDNLEEFRDVLEKSRKVARAAAQAFDSHLEEHRCNQMLESQRVLTTPTVRAQVQF